MLDTIASFLPGPYITHKITKTMTCISSVWDTTFNHYGVKPSTSSFLDYEDIKYNREDRYIDLYDKLVYHVMNHLCPAGTSNPNSSDKVLPTADTLTLSHRNNIAMDWLRKIDPALIKIVKLEYSKDLKAGIPLAALVPDISENIEAMLHRNKTHSVNLVSSPTNENNTDTPDVSVMRVSTPPYDLVSPQPTPEDIQPDPRLHNLFHASHILANLQLSRNHFAHLALTWGKS